MLPRLDVFWADLDTAAPALSRWLELLSADERARAAKYRFKRDRERYIARRGILRALLARRLGRAPGALRFATNRYGKPALVGGSIAFNLSHSRGLALYAFGPNIAIGCDIEFHDQSFLAEDIPERLFSPPELREFRGFAPEHRMAAFFDGWTRKEAFIKARGLGLALPLESFDVSLAPSDRPALYRGCDGWSARCVAPAPHCSATVITESSDWQMDAQPLDPFALLAEATASA
jgi:4'-phosphopantetheinyl transferase